MAVESRLFFWFKIISLCFLKGSLTNARNIFLISQRSLRNLIAILCPSSLGCFKVIFLLCVLSVCLALDMSDYSVDDECLVKLLKGCCLKNLQRPLQAELCFNHVIQRYRQTGEWAERKLRFPGTAVRKRRVLSRSECPRVTGKRIR